MVMWDNLPEDQKKYYKKLILSFASLSEAFSQKVETDGEDSEGKIQAKVAPIVNSKFQETVFQKSFKAHGEDYGNTSYDASVVVDDQHKYLVGLKSFGVGSGDQKIAQFKQPQADLGWRDTFTEIAKNASGLLTKEEIDSVNQELYLYLAKEISKLRNERIASSKENLRGFIVDNEDDIEAVYHYLMPSKKENTPQIFVGEAPYYEIDIDSIVIDGCTSVRKPMNFKFHDAHHQYKYTEADSQLLMTFDKTSLEDWDVKYVDDPFSIFAEIGDVSDEIEQFEVEKGLNIVQTISWKINIQKLSGFNQFMGLPKNSTQSIQSFVNVINDQFSEVSGISELITSLNKFKDSYSDKKSKEKYSARDEIMKQCESFSNNNELKKSAIKYLFRSANEIYIPLPSARRFHETYPNFFGTDYGKFSSDKKFVLPLAERQFRLEFLPSQTVIDAQITQDNGKAIQSSGNQDILGKWILEKVFQLSEFAPLTESRLTELEINGIRLTKFADSDNHIGLEFIWIDSDDLPNDYWK